jgi:hypothetical protein
MIWRKRGRVFVADGSMPWAQSGAMVPTPLLRDEALRIFVGFLDSEGIGRVGYVDVDRDDPARVIGVSNTPVLDIGVPGAFDDNGVLPLSIVQHDGVIYLYYVGFQLGVKVRFYMFCGRAESHDGGETFVRSQPVPVLERSTTERFSRAGAFVRRDDDGIWRAWYLSGNVWNDVGGKQVPEYHLRSIESPDGLHFGGSGRECMQLKLPDEYAIARPFVVRDGNLQRMFYSVRSKSKGYRLGYGESRDGVHWERRDADLGIDISESGWDSKDICWSSFVALGGRSYLFYNGNNFGADGFGLAELESW